MVESKADRRVASEEATSFEELPSPANPGALRLARAVAWLSLDVARPLHAALGLEVGRQGMLVMEAAREVVALHRERRRDRPDLPLDDLASLWRAALERRVDATHVREVARWFEEDFELAAFDPWNVWRLAVGEMLREPSVADRIDVPGVRRRYIVDVLGGVTDLEDVDAQLEAISGHELSDWDVEMFARQGYNPYDEATDPLASLWELAAMSRLRRGLIRLANDLSVKERAAVDTVMAEVLVDYEMALDPVPLGNLREWRAPT